MLISVILFTAIFAINSYEVNACWCSWICACNDYPPKGSLDTANCNNIGGWACDQDKYITSLTVQFTAAQNNPTLSAPGGIIVNIPAVIAGNNRGGLPCGDPQNHGFDFPTPPGLKDGKTYTIYAIANNINDRGDKDGNNEPIGTKTLGPCTVTPTTTGIDFNSPATFQVSVAVNEEKTLPISGGTSPYIIVPDTPCASNYAQCEIRQSGNDYSLYVKGLRDTSATQQGVTWTIIKDSSSTPKTKGVDVKVTGQQSWVGLLCSYPGPYPIGFDISYPVDNPPTIKEKVGRAMMCKPPEAASMDYVVEQANLLGANIRRNCCKPSGGPRDDTIDLPDGTVVDIIFSVGSPDAKWQWLPVGGGGACAGNPGASPNGLPCQSGPDYRNRMQGPWDFNRFDGDPVNIRYSPRWDIMYYAQCIDPGCPGALQTVLDKVRADGRVTKDGCNGGQSISFDSQGNLKLCSDEADSYVGIRGSGSGAYWLLAYYIVNVSGPPHPPGEIPEIWHILPTTVKVGNILNITGRYLTSIVQAKDKNGQNFTVTGNVNAEATQTTMTVPSYFTPGVYKIRIYKSADKISNEVAITIVDSSCINKKTPDEEGEVCCLQDTQCLLNPFGKDGTTECINSDEYSEDNYCENGLWSTRTKLLALKLLSLKSGDYTLFCGSKENTLNNLRYQTDTGQAVSDIVSTAQANNFCILKTQGNIIVAASVNSNKTQDLNGLFNVLGAASCNVQNDGNYRSCNSGNKVWYNKKLNTLIYSSNPIVITVRQEPTSFIVSIVNNILNTIKRLITSPPFDESYLTGIKKFRNLYMTEQNGKSIRGFIEATSVTNMVIEYDNFDFNICNSVDKYNEFKKLILSGVSCKNEGKNYFVLAQGSAASSFNPESIWPDMTSKLRLK